MYFTTYPLTSGGGQHTLKGQMSLSFGVSIAEITYTLLHLRVTFFFLHYSSSCDPYVAMAFLSSLLVLWQLKFKAQFMLYSLVFCDHNNNSNCFLAEEHVFLCFS
jgi:hypothetical protein